MIELAVTFQSALGKGRISPARELLELSMCNTIRVHLAARNGNGFPSFTFDNSPHLTF